MCLVAALAKLDLVRTTGADSRRIGCHAHQPGVFGTVEERLDHCIDGLSGLFDVMGGGGAHAVGSLQ